MEVVPTLVEAAGHETRPPARYTDASLIKRLEELGIGRPSTYASIISVIVDRGYVRKSGRELIPSFKAFLTVDLLDGNFEEFMELGFTARMDEALDEIAERKLDSKQYLKEFFYGTDERPGLKPAVDERKRAIPFPTFLVGNHPETDVPIVVRIGKDGSPFLQMEPAEGKKVYANIPDDLAPAEMTVERAVELFKHRTAAPEVLGVHPPTGRNLLLRGRPGGYYLEVERTEEEFEAKVKPTWVSLPPGADPRALSAEQLAALSALPRTIGTDAEGNEIVFRIGKYGPYVQGGKEIRNVEEWTKGLTMTVGEALEILAQPKHASRASAAVLLELGTLEGAEGPVIVKSGRYGPYVTDGTTNATLPKGLDPATLTPEAAIDLLRQRAAAGPSKSKPRARAGGKGKAKPKARSRKK